VLRQGGARSRPGTRFVAEVKHSTKDTILIPFQASVAASYMLEFGDTYIRFYKDKAPILSGGIPVEIASPYTEAQLRNIHFTQSVDVLFLFHPDVPQQKLSRISDTSWTILPAVYDPPPSFEDDTDISGGTVTLTPAATTGTSVIFTASAAVFLAGDIGRQIIYGSSYATIVAFGASAGDTASPNDHVRADILATFPGTGPIPAGDWLLRLSPQVTLDPDKKEPVGTQVTLVAGGNAFRAADVGKFITIYGGLVKITQFDSVTQVKGEIKSVMAGTDDANPAAAPAGAWTLEIESWSTTNGFPATGEFYQGRLGQARTPKQKTSFWLSQSDNFDGYAVGAEADRALEYTIASRALNQLEWIADNIDMFIGSAGSEHRVTSGRENEPLGGDVTPLVTRITGHGSASIQPVVIGRRTIFVDRSRRKVLLIGFDLEEDGFDTPEITGLAEHITASGIRLGPSAFATRPDPRIYYVREDGQAITLTYFKNEKVVGFTRLTTEGTFESHGVIPQVAPSPDQVWALVKRTINGVTKRYVEVFDEDASELAGRAWTSIETDCAKVYDLAGTPTTVLTGLGHLEGKTVDVITDGSYRGTKVVASAQITLTEAASETAEVGLHFDGTLTTMRPAVEGMMVEGLPRSWKKLWARVLNSMGGKLNGIELVYPTVPLTTRPLYTGDVEITTYAVTDTDGAVTLLRDKPYPMTVLALFGEVEFGTLG